MWKWIAGIVATVISGVSIWWLTEVLPRSVIPPTQPTARLEEAKEKEVRKKPPEEEPWKDLKIDTSGIETYFVVSDLKPTKGFAQANSTIQFLIKSKGTFVGAVYTLVNDKDGVAVPCNTYMYCFNNAGVLVFPSKTSLQFPYVYSWYQNEAQRVQVYVHFDASSITFGFSQAK